MLKVGQLNKLTVLRGTSVGYYLSDEDDNDVLLPIKYIPENLSVGDEIEVFIYRDSEDRIIATTLEPFVKLNEFALLKVKAVTKIGAFLDWGLEKDLFVPFREQNQKLKDGDYTVIYLYLDEATDRLVGSCKVNKFFEKEDIVLIEGQEVSLLVFEKTDLGFNCIINNKYKGLIYHNEIFQRVAWGDVIPGFVKAIREDKRIDLSLQKGGFENIEPNSNKILQRLKVTGGVLNLGDKSEPVDILAELEMSKKLFKKAVGNLYKQKLIEVSDYSIKLVES